MCGDSATAEPSRNAFDSGPLIRAPTGAETFGSRVAAGNCHGKQPSSASYAVAVPPGSGRRIASSVPAAVSVVISSGSVPWTVIGQLNDRDVSASAPVVAPTTAKLPPNVHAQPLMLPVDFVIAHARSSDRRSPKSLPQN